MNLNYFENLVNQKLLMLHTCYLAKVISVSGGQARIQPLALIKAYQQQAQKQAIVENVPICKHALEDATAGAVVVVACMERDITQTKKGELALPSLRHHSLSDSIIIGVLADGSESWIITALDDLVDVEEESE